MATSYTDIEQIARRIIPQKAVENVVTLVREGENDFCERTWCLETSDLVDTLTVNNGILAATYALPSNFVRLFRLEWNGVRLNPGHLKGDPGVYDSAGSEETGIPTEYWIENDRLRLRPKPSAHGYLSRWYAVKNTATSGDYPIIPEIERRKLANYAIWQWLEIDGQYEKAAVYEARYLRDCRNAYVKYRVRRGKQTQIIDVSALKRSRFPAIPANIVQGTTEEEVAMGLLESQQRSDGTPATGDPLDIFQAGGTITHVFHEIYLFIPIVTVEPKSDWPVFVKAKPTVTDGILTVLVGIGGQGTAVEADFDYTVLVYNQPDTST